ncbi:hypothetical protein GKE56_09470 [Nostocoides sp. HKS02]|nr:hypothetical protein GKE56_09470 [Tetrasphaera sp. HKS02]
MWRWDDTPPSQATTHPQCTPVGAGRPTNAAIRKWANANGYHVQDRGRIPASVKAAFDAARM